MSNLKIKLSISELEDIISSQRQQYIKIMWYEEKFLWITYYKFYMKYNRVIEEELSNETLVYYVMKKLFGKYSVGEAILNDVKFNKPNDFTITINR